MGQCDCRRGISIWVHFAHILIKRSYRSYLLLLPTKINGIRLVSILTIVIIILCTIFNILLVLLLLRLPALVYCMHMYV